MDGGILDTIKSNVTRELGDASDTLADDIKYYLDAAIRDVANYPYWSWYPASSAENDVIDAMPDNFETVIEYSILSKIESREVRGDWLKMYNDELVQRKAEDMGKIEDYASGTNAKLTAFRDEVYYDIANYPHWAWYPASVSDVDDIKAAIPSDFTSVVKYGILGRIGSMEHEKLYQALLKEKIAENYNKIGVYASGTNSVLTAFRDEVYYDIANYPHWAWYPASVSDVDDIKTAIPSDFTSVVKYGILSRMGIIENEKLYQFALKEKIAENITKIGKYADGTNTVLTRFRDAIYREIAAYCQWRWLQEVPISLSTTDDQAHVDIPSYLYKVISAYKVGDFELVKISWADYSSKIAGYAGTSNQPRFITKQGSRWYLFPTPNGAGDIYFFATINPDLLTDDDPSGVEGVKTKIPSHFDNIVEYGILSRVDSAEKYGDWSRRFYSGLAMKKDEDGKERGRHIRGVKDKAASRSYHFTSGGGALRDVSIWED